MKIIMYLETDGLIFGKEKVLTFRVILDKYGFSPYIKFISDHFLILTFKYENEFNSFLSFMEKYFYEMDINPVYFVKKYHQRLLQ